MTLRERNNLARKKCYEKQLERQYALDYEFFMCSYHEEKLKHKTWHWKYIPEEDLFKAGFINDYNKLRLSRIEKRNSGENNIREYGLDGLSLDYEGNYHGLQAKFWKSRKLTADDLGTFFSVIFSRFIPKNSLSKGFLYHTCDLQVDVRDDFKNNPNLENLKLPFKPVKIEEPEEIEVDETKFTLYPPQQEALTELKKGWEDVGLISMPCALGKTVLLGNYLMGEDYQQIIILSPLKVLTKQMLDRIKPFIPHYFELLVDSDEGGTTDEEYILEMMDKHQCLISITYESFENIFLDKELDNVLLVIDEAHNLGSWNKINEKIEELEQVLLLTATPTIDMEDIAGFEVIYDYPMREAINNGYVTDYLINLPVVINDKVDIDIPVELKDLDEDLTMKSLFLISGMLETGSRKCIIYCGDIEECKKFNEIFEKVCLTYHGIKCWIDRINKDIGKKKRDDILKDFQENEMKLSVLTSVRILNEGINIVKCDSVFITKVNKNEITAVQRMCRANRLDKENPNKIANCFIWSDDMNKTVNMLQYLRDNDETQFFNKIKCRNGNYERKNGEQEVKKVTDYEKTVVDTVRIKSMSFEEIQLERAKGIVERGILRENKGLNKIPKRHKDNTNPENRIETNDNACLKKWKLNIKESVRNYLDKNLKGWDYTLSKIRIEHIIKLVKRAINRNERGLNLLPKLNKNPKNIEEELENKDYHKLVELKKTLKGKGKCCLNIEEKKYLDKNLKNWDKERNYLNINLENVKNIYLRCIKRKENGSNFLPICFKKPINDEEIIEKKDAMKLINYRIKFNKNCLENELKDYLDKNLIGWNITRKDNLSFMVDDIIKRAIERKRNGKNLLPINRYKPKNEKEKQETKDNIKLNHLRQSIKGNSDCVCPLDIKKKLDEKLGNWI